MSNIYYNAASQYSCDINNKCNNYTISRFYLGCKNTYEIL